MSENLVNDGIHSEHEKSAKIERDVWFLFNEWLTNNYIVTSDVKSDRLGLVQIFQHFASLVGERKYGESNVGQSFGKREAGSVAVNQQSTNIGSHRMELSVSRKVNACPVLQSIKQSRTYGLLIVVADTSQNEGNVACRETGPINCIATNVLD